jgi:hypothetical protein
VLPRDVGLLFNDMDMVGRHSAMEKLSARRYFGINFEGFFERAEGSKEVYHEGKKYYLRFGDLFEDLLKGNFINPSCAVIRREVYEDIGGFREDFSVAEDSDYFLRVSRRYKICFIPLPLTSVELPDSSISLSRPVHNLLKVKNSIVTVTQLINDVLDPRMKRSLRRRVAILNSLAAYHHLTELDRDIFVLHLRRSLPVSCQPEQK